MEPAEVAREGDETQAATYVGDPQADARAGAAADTASPAPHVAADGAGGDGDGAAAAAGEAAQPQEAGHASRSWDAAPAGPGEPFADRSGTPATEAPPPAASGWAVDATASAGDAATAAHSVPPSEPGRPADPAHATAGPEGASPEVEDGAALQGEPADRGEARLLQVADPAGPLLDASLGAEAPSPPPGAGSAGGEAAPAGVTAGGQEATAAPDGQGATGSAAAADGDATGLAEAAATVEAPAPEAAAPADLVALPAVAAALGLAPYLLRSLLDEYADILPTARTAAGLTGLGPEAMARLRVIAAAHAQGLSADEIRRRLAAQGDEQAPADALLDRMELLQAELSRSERRRVEDRDRLLLALVRTQQEVQHLRYELVGTRRSRRRGFWARLFGRD